KALKGTEEHVSDEEVLMVSLPAQSRVIDLEKENATLRQLVSDLLTWARDGFHLSSASEKGFWEMHWEELQQCASELGIGGRHEPVSSDESRPCAISQPGHAS